MLLVGLGEPRSEMGLPELKRPPASAAIAAAAFMLISMARLIDDGGGGDGVRLGGEAPWLLWWLLLWLCPIMS